jgi:[ribosomal protein S5]-alanine N-acetyltransferase
MPPEFLAGSLQNDRAGAEAMPGVTASPEWFDEPAIIKIMLDKVQREPSIQVWSIRGMVLRSQKRMIGHLGFHSKPDPVYLRELAPGGIEIGYTVYPEFRRQGYALEAVRALIAWAYQEHQVERFVLSISPENTPSLRIAERLGFIQIGSHIDEEDGLENIYLLRYPGEQDDAHPEPALIF